MNADLSGRMWSVAPKSATSKEVCLTLPRKRTIECGGELFGNARTVLGRYMVLTLLGSNLDLDEAVGPPIERSKGVVEAGAEATSELDAGSKVPLRQEGVE
jgi:hypothetical protein